jgi:hypothetical protein
VTATLLAFASTPRQYTWLVSITSHSAVMTRPLQRHGVPRRRDHRPAIGRWHSAAAPRRDGAGLRQGVRPVDARLVPDGLNSACSRQLSPKPDQRIGQGSLCSPPRLARPGGWCLRLRSICHARPGCTSRGATHTSGSGEIRWAKRRRGRVASVTLNDSPTSVGEVPRAVGEHRGWLNQASGEPVPSSRSLSAWGVRDGFSRNWQDRPGIPLQQARSYVELLS